jgi:hypothetical protein
MTNHGCIRWERVDPAYTPRHAVCAKAQRAARESAPLKLGADSTPVGLLLRTSLELLFAGLLCIHRRHACVVGLCSGYASFHSLFGITLVRRRGRRGVRAVVCRCFRGFRGSRVSLMRARGGAGGRGVWLRCGLSDCEGDERDRSRCGIDDCAPRVHRSSPGYVDVSSYNPGIEL